MMMMMMMTMIMTMMMMMMVVMVMPHGDRYYYNGTHNATLIGSCLSVKGQPTRGRDLDGKGGRAAGDIFIPQPRRQAPG
jgi:hypothetical protein